MLDFYAIDFETANAERSSVCSVGIVIVKDGEIVDKFYSLIQPEPDYYSYWNTRVHGLTQKDTMDAPVPYIHVGKKAQVIFTQRTLCRKEVYGLRNYRRTLQIGKPGQP